MAIISQLKQKAREWERREQWKPALDAYEQITRETGGAEEVEIGLWNRIGDLHMRLAQPLQAITAFERAADAYAEAGLHNNAIALCNKILRTAPDNTAVLLKLAQISALKGFVADARQSVARYLAEARTRGEVEAARELLFRTAEAQPPQSAELRFVVAEAMEAEASTEQAIKLLRDAHRILAEAGEEERALRIQEQIDRLVPPSSAPADPAHRAPSGRVVGSVGSPRVAEIPLLSLAAAARPPVSPPVAAGASGVAQAGDRAGIPLPEEPVGRELPLLDIDPSWAPPSAPAAGALEPDAPLQLETSHLLATPWDAPVGGEEIPDPEVAADEAVPLLGLIVSGYEDFPVAHGAAGGTA